MGDGMRRVLAVATSLVSAENGILLVDEIDTGLHYETLTDMWRLILETSIQRNAQVFATTHSWDCVKSFQEALSTMPDDDVGRLIRLEPQDDHIQAITYSRDELTIAIQNGIEVR
jgi:AAA15 family ATPase/GTPase